MAAGRRHFTGSEVNHYAVVLEALALNEEVVERRARLIERSVFTDIEVGPLVVEAGAFFGVVTLFLCTRQRVVTTLVDVACWDVQESNAKPEQFRSKKNLHFM